MYDLDISIRLAKFILNLKEDNFYSFKDFIIDFFKDFSNENKNYWEYEAWAKAILDTKLEREKQKVIIFKKGKIDTKNKFNVSIVFKYASLLKEIFDNDLFTTLYCHISNENRKHDFLLFIDYLMENYRNKSKILEALEKMSEIGIYEFTYKKDFNFDGEYEFIESINSGQGVFSDGNMNWLSRTNSSFPVSISGANYIIEYKKQSNIYSFRTMKLKNFDFDLNTLPTKKMLSCTGAGIDRKVVNDKTIATDLVYELNSCTDSLKKAFELYESLIQSLEIAKTKEEYDIIKTKLLEIQNSLEQLKLFLISECEQQNIIKSPELKDSLERKSKSLGSKN